MPAIDSPLLPAHRLELHDGAPQVSNRGVHIEHSRGSGLAPNGVWSWSSYEGNVQDLVSTSEPRSGGLLGGMQRKPLPTVISIDTTIAPAAIDPQLTRHLSADLHNLIVDLIADLMDGSMINQQLSYLGGGSLMANYALNGTSGPIGLSLRIDTRGDRADVTALGITWPNGQQLGAPIPIPAVQLGDGFRVTAPLEVLARHPWLEGVLSQAAMFSVSLQPQDPLEPTLWTAHFKRGESTTVGVKLRQTPDGTYQVIDSEERVLRPSQPQVGFSYSRGAILHRIRTVPGRRMQFSDMQVDRSWEKVKKLENIFESARQASAWIPDALNSKRWFTSVRANNAPLVLRIEFDDDTLDHAVDIQEYVPGTMSELRREKPFFEPWAAKPRIPGQCQRIVETWFKEAQAYKKWSEANPSGDAAGFINEALKACAVFEARYDGQEGIPQRSDATLATCKPWGGDTARHIYRYDTVVYGQDVSLLVEFSHPNRRVWMSMAMLAPGEQPDAAKIKGILLESR